MISRWIKILISTLLVFTLNITSTFAFSETGSSAESEDQTIDNSLIDFEQPPVPITRSGQPIYGGGAKTSFKIDGQFIIIGDISAKEMSYQDRDGRYAIDQQDKAPGEHADWSGTSNTNEKSNAESKVNEPSGYTPSERNYVGFDSFVAENNSASSRSQREKLIGAIDTDVAAKINNINSKVSQNREVPQNISSLNFQTVRSSQRTGLQLNDGSFANDLFNGIASKLQAQAFTLDIGNIAAYQIDSAPYVSSERNKISDQRSRLDTCPTKSPQQWDAKVAAYKTLRAADNSYNSGDKISGDALFDIAVALVDIATDFVPITSVPKDFLRLTVGVDPLTGHELNKYERGAALLGLATIGIGHTIIDIGKVAIYAEKALQYTREEVKIFEKIAPALEHLPKEWSKPVRIRAGNPEKLAVVGRGMVSRPGEVGSVTEVANALKAHGFEVAVFENSGEKTFDVISEEAVENYKEVALKFKSRIPYQQQAESLLFKENMSWGDRLIKENYTVIDMGDPKGLDKIAPSAFYDGEKMKFFGEIK